ncbi:ATP-dependent DNA helicase PIF1-like [Bactrocera dorsalis]|uniref:ATP-dependent DNA helicase n=1 Tax=Bactrocera dorsalis TaxID=27457 RepID=A0ABM3J184_BACDO|nr:ATP-dependent DNA helicase PIF1-like [Bactrocera dorsalis]
MADDFNEYKREMVTLYTPFRDEENEILADTKFIQIYDDNEMLILERHKEFSSNLDIQKTIEICRELCHEDELNQDDDAEGDNVGRLFPEANLFQELYNADHIMKDDLQLATLNKLGAIAKKRDNLMSNEQFYELMRMANQTQKALLMHVIANLKPITTPNNDGFCNAYIACASTGKAEIAIDGTTIHTALKISLSKLLPLSIEVAQQYRMLFKYVQVILIDEVSMVGAELLSQIDARLKQITGNFQDNFGGMDIIFIGDLRQLPPVRATPIYQVTKRRIAEPTLWRDLKFYELDKVMRQANADFSSLLTKIGNGEELDQEQIHLIESRFYTREEADRLCPHGIRLYLTNNASQFVRQKLHKKTVIDTGGLPYEIILVLDKWYIITTNLDVSDGLANGAVGKLVHIETDEAGAVTRVWLEFPDSPKAGRRSGEKLLHSSKQTTSATRQFPLHEELLRYI